LGRSYLALAALATTAGLTAACGGGTSDEEQVYCADASGFVVDDDWCDDDGDGRGRRYYLWAGRYGSGHKPGYRLPGGTRFDYNDAAARARYGLPASGKIANGTVVPNGFGSGSRSDGGGGSVGG
jgi:hypothetical protein